MNSRTFLRTWLACLIGCIPLLVLLLIPQLVRSRASDERLLALGVGLLLLLVTAAFVLAPVMSAWLAPVRESWVPQTALRVAASVWRQSTGGAVIALLAGIAIYAGGQAAGYWLGSVVPYVSDNPDFAADPSQQRWLIHYPAFALQAIVLYLASTLAVAFYGWRVRSLHLHLHQATASATASHV
ncbi:hypothetical protein [Agromyces subbeticus]|uniref:hypothetical protein n=1 Tax=Agromyces subbeticus TaxID=293890 RepID=UPI00040361CC|nr:hypothetical protein [Agromyces subbeticus]